MYIAIEWLKTKLTCACPATTVQVFTMPLYFSRQTGAFVELSSGECRAEDKHSATDVNDTGLPASDDDDERRERMMLWATTERLPIFLRHWYILRSVVDCLN